MSLFLFKFVFKFISWVRNIFSNNNCRASVWSKIAPRNFSDFGSAWGPICGERSAVPSSCACISACPPTRHIYHHLRGVHALGNWIRRLERLIMYIFYSVWSVDSTFDSLPECQYTDNLVYLLMPQSLRQVHDLFSTL